MCADMPMKLGIDGLGRPAISATGGDLDDFDPGTNPGSLSFVQVTKAGLEPSPDPYTSSFHLDGDAVADDTGAALVGGLDLNEDGNADFAVGAPSAAACETPDYPFSCADETSYRGSIFVVFGEPGRFGDPQALSSANLGLARDGLLHLHAPEKRAALHLTGALPYGFAGKALAAADFDGDGGQDLVIGQPGDPGKYAAGGPPAGRVFILFSTGTKDAFPFGHYELDPCPLRAAGVPMLEIDSPYAGGLFGASLAAGKDVDGDGIPDLLVGAPADGPTSQPIGRVYAYSGAALAQLKASSGLSCATTQLNAETSAAGIFQATASSGTLGTEVALLSDFSGDGKADIALGAPDASDTTGQVGAVLVWRAGRPLAQLNTNTPDFTLLGDQPGALAEMKLASSPDLSGDGIPELVLGAPKQVVDGDPVSWDSGAVYVVFGRSFSTGSRLVLPGTAGELFKAGIRRFRGTYEGEETGGSIAVGTIPTGSTTAETWLLIGRPGYLDGTGTERGLVTIVALQKGDRWTAGDGWPWQDPAGVPARVAQVQASDALGFGRSVAFAGDIDRDESNAPEVVFGTRATFEGSPAQRTQSSGAPNHVYLFWGSTVY
jgi:hypothetical protein